MSIPAPFPARVHEFSIIANERVAESVFRLVIEAPKLAAALTPGEFMSFAVPGDATQLVRIPLSYSATDPEAGTIETYYAVVGDGTRRLSCMKPGESSTVLGPGGKGWKLPHEAQRVLLVAGGIGITPIISAGRMLQAAHVAYDSVVGVLTASRLCGTEVLTDCGSETVRITTDDGSAGTKGLVTTEVAPMLAQHEYDAMFACGPEPMMHAVAELASSAYVACQVSLERMMTCGFGACATCAVETTGGMVGACAGGPVFDAEKVVW